MPSGIMSAVREDARLCGEENINKEAESLADRKIHDAMKIVREDVSRDIEDLLGDVAAHSANDINSGPIHLGSMGQVASTLGSGFNVNPNPHMMPDEMQHFPNTSFTGYFTGSNQNLIGGSSGMLHPQMRSVGSLRGMQMPNSFIGQPSSPNQLGTHPSSLSNFAMMPSVPQPGIYAPPGYHNRSGHMISADQYEYHLGPMQSSLSNSNLFMNPNVSVSPVIGNRNGSVQNLVGQLPNGSPRPVNPGVFVGSSNPSNSGQWRGVHQGGPTHKPMGPSDRANGFMSQMGSMQQIGSLPPTVLIDCGVNHSNLLLPEHQAGDMGITSTGPPLGLDPIPSSSPEPIAPVREHQDRRYNQNNQRVPPRGSHNGKNHNQKGNRAHNEYNPETSLPNKSKGNRQNNHHQMNQGPIHLSDYLDHLTELCLDQGGSRKVQQSLTCDSRNEREQNVEIMITHIDMNLICDDIFGNYVVQKCAEFGNDAQRLKIAKILGPNIQDYSVKMCGCRVIQALIEHSDKETNEVIFASIKDYICEMVTSQNGNHVVQKAIQNMDDAVIAEIVEILMPKCLLFAKHGYGCRVMQRLLERADVEMLSPIFDVIMMNAKQMVVDQYGNYVLQHIAGYGRPQDKQVLLDLILEDFVPYAKGKFSSNVVEKVLGGNISQDVLCKLVQDLNADTVRSTAKSGDAGSPVTSSLIALMTDRFANYVMQRLFNSLNTEGKMMMVEMIMPYYNLLARSTTGKYILANIESLGLIPN